MCVPDLSPSGRRLHVGLRVRNGDKMLRDGKLARPHLSFFPTLTLNYDITSLHNFRICDLGAVFILCNVIQTALGVSRRDQCEQNSEILS